MQNEEIRVESAMKKIKSVNSYDDFSNLPAFIKGVLIIFIYVLGDQGDKRLAKKVWLHEFRG